MTGLVRAGTSSRRRLRLAAVLRERAERVRATLRVGRLPSERRLPRVRIALGPHVPGWVLRLALAVVATGCAVLVVHGPVATVLAGLAVLAVLALVARPDGVAGGVFAVGVGIVLATGPREPFTVRSCLLLLGLHLLLQLALLGARVGWTVLLELRVLVGPARRFLLLQAGAQLLALGGAALTTRGLTLPWLPVLVGVGLTVLVWKLLSRLTG